MSAQKITNTFGGGLDWDNHLTVGKNEDYRYATNLISTDENQDTFLSNEHSTRKIATFPGEIVGKRYISQLNSTVFFIEGGKIYLFNHATEELKFVAESSEFGCSWGMEGCEWIDIHAYYQYINDLWITYSSNKTYYNINLTELLDETRKAGLKQSLSGGCGDGCAKRTCSYFKVFKKSCDPHIEAIPEDGGNLRNGTYFVGGRYLNTEGGYSNPFIMSTAIHIGGKDNIAGEISKKKLVISIHNNSCIYDQIEIFIHEIINGETLTRVLPVQYISGNNFTIEYTGNNGGIPIDIAELMVNSKTYIEGEDLLIHNNRAIYYRTTPDFEYNFQSVANQIQVNWVAVKVPLKDVKRYNLKSFMRGETYAFSFSPNYSSGKKGYGFHIPAINSGGDCASIPYYEPEEEVHITGGQRKKSDADCGSDNPALAKNGVISLRSGGCSGNTSKSYYIDTDNFCNCTKLYIDSEKSTLAPSDTYKLDYDRDSFVRTWDGNVFTSPCNIYIDGTSGGGGGTCSDKSSISGSISLSTSNSVNIQAGISFERTRNKIPSTISNPTSENFKDLAKALVEDWKTTNQDIVNAIGPAMNPETGCIDCGGDNGVDLQTSSEDCGEGTIVGDISINVKHPKDELNQFANVKDQQKNKDIANKDSDKAEKIGALWYNALSNFIFEESEIANDKYTRSNNTITGTDPAKLLKNPVNAISTLRQASKDLIKAVENRERFEFKYKPHTIDKSSTYSSDSLSEGNNHEWKPFSSTNYDIKYSLNGDPIVENSNDVYSFPGNYNKYPIVGRGRTIPKQESNKYPCTTDCYGNQIYCGLADQPVTHHTFPSNVEIPYWEPKNSGDGSTYQNDADIMDGYAILLGVEFTNINIPLAIKGYLCSTNPYTFGVVKRNSSNSSVILKGLGTEMYKGQNNGKDYLYFKYGLNSFEKISRFIDTGNGKRFGNTSDDTNNINIYSLDQLTRTPYLGGTHIIREGTFNATGARHFLTAKGIEVNDNRAKRRDQSGSVHTMTIHNYSPSNVKLEIQGQGYVDANTVGAPDGGDTPFMNKYGQSCAWITANGIGRGVNDDSFVGDVLQEKAPIQRGEADYFSIIKEMDSQYGDLSSLNYSPILQARGFNQSIMGLVGDSYIGPYSFVKTGYVSDRIGNFFPIGNMVPGKVDRSICDCPDDAAVSLIGNWYWKQLPKDGDAADAKRWAGTHTTTITKTWSEAQSTNQTESGYYFPGTTKALITYVGEFDANPWLRERTDLLKEQIPNDLKLIYNLHSEEPGGADWTLGYLNQWYKLWEQASPVALGLKVLILSMINIALPLLGISDWTNPESGIEFAGDMLSKVIQIGVWLMVSQVLFTNDFVDRFLGLDGCKRDEEGSNPESTEAFFENYSGYNGDYSIDYFLPTIKGLPLEYTGCMATNSITNNFYISDENDISYYVNGYQVVRPNSYKFLEETHGKITKIYDINNRLFLHTTAGIYSIQIAQPQLDTNIGSILLGNSQIVSMPHLITASSPEGSFGLLHPNHGVMTDKGFIFIDYNSKDIILFKGDGFDILSGRNFRMSTFFKKYLDFCNNSDCKFEYKNNTSNYIFGIDNLYDRIIFTKNDGNNSYTLSYDLATKRWKSFHSYTPQLYHNDRNDIFMIYNNELHKHDDHSKYNTYFDKYEGFLIDFTSTLDQEYFDYLSTEIFTEAVQKDSRNRDITFNQVSISNDYQTTGPINLNVIKKVGNLSNNLSDRIKDNIKTINTTRTIYSFRFDEIFDYTKNHNSENISYDECNPEPKLINYGNYIDRSDQSYINRIVSSNYLYYRFIFNKFANIKLYLKKIDTYISRKTM